MTYAPSTLVTLRNYLQAHTGASATALGIVGDAAHQTRPSYHNGWDVIVSHGRTCAKGDYTICTPRDRAFPHTAAAAAMDIGRPSVAHGGYAGLHRMSIWLVKQAQASAPGTRDIREIIFTPDGRTVLRWDRERGVGSAPLPGEADTSHLWHTHVSWYRDSEKRDKTAVFRRYYEPDVTPAYRVGIASGKPTPIYDAAGNKVNEISGLTVTVADRLALKIQGHWLYRILEGKYSGRYIAPTEDTAFVPV